jgi:predicted ATPase
MKLTINNIGTIQEASINIKGLTVIAGENDTGKSTIGKILFASIKADNIAFKQKANKQQSKEILATRLNLIFDGNITENGSFSITDSSNNIITEASIKDGNYVETYTRGKSSREKFFDATIVQSPVVFDLVGFFDSVAKMKERQKFEYGLDFDVSYPYILWDLYDKLSRENPFVKSQIQKELCDSFADIIGGEFKQENGKFYYYKYFNKRALKIEMLNTAYGIKSFAILQLLNKNRFIDKKTIIILDEPEVHLHPKWQLKMAEIIVQLVHKGIKIIVNSHSPYMIEALKRYSTQKNIHCDFYLAQNNTINKINNSNEATLTQIFDKLSEPFEAFDSMDSELLQNG